MKKFTLNLLIVALAFIITGKVEAQDVVDLTAMDDPNALVDTLDGVNSGATILLKPGMTYNAGGFAFDKSVTIKSSEPSNLNRPKIDCSSNFNFVEDAVIDSIIFMNLELAGEYDSRYVLNGDKSATVGKLMFKGCYIHDLRGVVRVKSGTGTLDNYIIDDCMITMVRDYGILTVDVNTWACNNIMLLNSTIYKTRVFIQSKNNTESVLIDACNLSETPAAGQRMFRWRESGQDNVTGGISVKNTLWGTGWDETASGSTAFVGYEGLDATTWTFENLFVTNDIAFSSDSIDLWSSRIDEASTVLWKNPASGNLHFADTTFTGIGNAGDQRWAIGGEGIELVWNISAAAYKNLGTLDATQKVAGMTIYANSSKTVTIDDNNKTLNDMDFTNRLKLGGSGSFEDGQPLGRVLAIDVKGNTNITVAAMSSSSSSDRVLNIASGHKDSIIAEFPALGASLTSGDYTYTGGATKLFFYSPSSGVNVYYIKTSHVANTDANLASLELSAGTLTPAFDAAVTAYTADVPYGTSSVNVIASTTDPSATVTGDGVLDVSSGSGTTTVVATAEDGLTTKTYTVVITVLPSSGEEPEIIDLSAYENADILLDTLPDLVSGSTVLLKPGMVYNAGGHAFTKSVILESKEPSNLNRPKIDCASNFNFGEFANIDSLVFKNLEFFGEYDARYVLNSNVAATVGKLIFDGCYIHDLRGILRMKDAGPGSLDEYVIKDCMVTKIRDYGIITVDINTWAVNNILLQNSSFSKIRAFMTSRNNTETLVIDGCTINEAPAAGQRMFRWREAGQNNVTGGIMVKNTLWGSGWDEENSGSTAFDGFDGLDATTWTFENTYNTSDLAFSSDTIEGFNSEYPGLTSALWYSDTSSNFTFADTTFDGIGNAGDPRWAIATADGSREWNISAAAYKNLGKLEATQKVAGLTIHANADKSVTIDGNNKTVDDMDFTNRLKLGGSGSFDDNGQPLGRVLSIDVSGNTGITVAAMSSSSSSDRILNIAAGHKDSIIAEFPAMGAGLTKGQYTYEGGATKLFFYSPSSGVNVYYLKAGHILGTDATLSGISVSSGTLSPEFSAEQTAYTLEVPSGSTTVTVNASTNDPNASVSGTGDVDVSSGSGIATVTVTAEDGTSTMVYTVTITVEANNDASLSNLTISEGLLSPFFDATILTYNVVLPQGTTTVNVDATQNDANATVTGDGDIDVSSGSGTATVVVTAEDGTTTETYTINFTVLSSVDDEQLKLMSVYPTLSNGIFTIEFFRTPGKITVYDLTGNKVLEKNASSLVETIYLDQAGVYMIRLESENESHIVRVLSLK